MKYTLFTFMMIAFQVSNAMGADSPKFCLSDTVGIINGKRVCVACKPAQKSKFGTKEACEKGGK